MYSELFNERKIAIKVMSKADKYIVTKIKMIFKDGTKSVIRNLKKEVYNIESYREYLMAQNNAIKIEFTYDTIPVENQGEIRIKL